jgi:predicted nucleic acid-binding protein
MVSTFTAFFDANVLFGARLRSLVIESAKSGLFRAKWTEDIHREWMEAVTKQRPEIIPEALERTRRAMDRAVPDCLVTRYEQLIPSIILKDPDDRHVVAGAIAARASVIVTFNVKDFPQHVLAPFGLHTEHPDDFLMDIENLGPGMLIQAVLADWKHYKNPPLTLDTYLEDLVRAGLPKTAAYLKSLKVLVEIARAQSDPLMKRPNP